MKSFCKSISNKRKTEDNIALLLDRQGLDDKAGVWKSLRLFLTSLSYFSLIRLVFRNLMSLTLVGKPGAKQTNTSVEENAVMENMNQL